MGSRGGRHGLAPGAVPLTWTRAYLNFATNRYQKFTWSRNDSARTPHTGHKAPQRLCTKLSVPLDPSHSHVWGTAGASKIVSGVLPRNSGVDLLRLWRDCFLDRVPLVAPPAEQQERTPLERQRRWPAQEVSKNITSRQMESRKLRHRASSDKSVAPLDHDWRGNASVMSAGNTRKAASGSSKSGAEVQGPGLGCRSQN